MELKKKMDEIYLKLNNLGEVSVIRKPPEVRKEEYKNMKIEEEIKKLEEKEKLEKNGGFFSTQIR